MKGISFGLVLMVLLGFALTGAAADRVRIVDGVNEKTTSLDMDKDRLVWADETEKIVRIYSFSTGRTESIKTPVNPRTIKVAGEDVYFLSSKGFPYSLRLRTSKISRLDTVSADGISANGSYIVWFNADRAVVHELSRGKRTEFKAGQVIRGASISGETLTYIDGGKERDLLFTVNLRNGQQRSYALQGTTGLDSAYPMVAVPSGRSNVDSQLRLLNLETEHSITVEKVKCLSDPDLAERAVVFQAQNDYVGSEKGIYLYEIIDDRLTLLSRDGIRPVVTESRAAWLEAGGIWVADY